jgi:hypothetical protein
MNDHAAEFPQVVACSIVEFLMKAEGIVLIRRINEPLPVPPECLFIHIHAHSRDSLSFLRASVKPLSTRAEPCPIDRPWSTVNKFSLGKWWTSFFWGDIPPAVYFHKGI